MRVVYPEQIREIDRRCESEYGISESKLMENAGRGVYIETINYLKMNKLPFENLKIACICGKGNNGGDGFVAARYFINHGSEVIIFVCSSYESFKQGSSFSNYTVLKNMGANIYFLTENELPYLKSELYDCDVIIDALLGIGLNSEVKGLYAKVIDSINKNNKPVVVSVDIPSGADGLTGQIMGTAVSADLTVVMAVLKTGNLIQPGKECCGKITVFDIGVPEELMAELKIKIFETERTLVKEFFPKRKAETNKGTYGKIGIISGSSGMTGAGIMASKSAMRTGAGLVYNIVPDGLADIYECASFETVTVPVNSDELFFTEECTDDVLDACRNLDVIVIGPGLGTNEETGEFLSELLTGFDNYDDVYKKTLIIDADALNLIARDTNILKDINMTAILTPHPGEMARLCGVSIKDVQADRINAVRYLSEEFEKIVILKGASTLTSFPDGSVFINPTGNPGMATAGAGDVLCGIIAAMAASGNSEFAAACGVYLHGLAGDFASEKYGEYSMIASDIIENISEAVKHIIEE